HGRRRDELHREVRVVEQALAATVAEPFHRDLQDLERRLREVEQRLVPVNALLHVDLRDRLQPRGPQHVDEEAGLDAIEIEDGELSVSTLTTRSPFVTARLFQRASPFPRPGPTSGSTS